MNINVFSCKECGAPLRVAEGQFISVCNFCNVKYYVKQDLPPAITIKDNVELDEAKKIVLGQLRNGVVSTGFLSNSYFERGTLFFIPFIEIRGIKARNMERGITGKSEFGYSAYDYIEHGSNLSDLDIDFIDSSILENTLLEAELNEYNIVEMRKSGIVLPLKPMTSFKKKNEPDEQDVVEKHVRIIYFPVWEINYTYRGIIFKSYISATDGSLIKIQAIKNHRKKLLVSILGLFSLAILFSRGIKFLLFSLKSADLGLQGGGLLSLISLFGALLTIILFSFLIPYFWEMFAFREIVSIRKDGIDSRVINYSENNLMKFGREILKKVEFFFNISNSKND